MAWLTRRHAIEGALKSGADGVLYLLRKSSRYESLAEEATRRDVPVRYVSAEKLRRLAGPDSRGAAFEVAEPGDGRSSPTVDLKSWLETSGTAGENLVVALDHITDPHNLGAILRSCHWFDVSLVIIPDRRSATGGDVVARASAGAVSFVPVAFVSNLRQALDLCRQKGYWVYGADTAGPDISAATVHTPTVLVLGGEGKGISPGLEKVLDGTLEIPRPPFRTGSRGGTTTTPDSTVDSLNVSVAAGILLYALRYRGNEQGRGLWRPPTRI
jgi:23S rRNA (guanosine2251-2'-O)-methyltransferase